MNVDRITPIVMRLAELFPQTFAVYEQRRRPLAVGIRAAISERVGDAITPDELNAALRAYTRNVGYQKALAQPGAMRIDCDGNEVTPVTVEQQTSAAKAVASHWARVAERKAAARLAMPQVGNNGGGAGGSVQVRPISEKPKRISLSDLRAAARERKAASV